MALSRGKQTIPPPLSVNLFGDGMTDVWIECEKLKLSAEGPHVIGKVKATHQFPGGACNVQVNLESLGVTCTYAKGGDPVHKSQWSYPSKARIVVDDQILLRVDEPDELKPIPLGEALDGWNPKLPTVLVDYGKGSISDKLAKTLLYDSEGPLFIHVKGDPSKYTGGYLNSCVFFFCNGQEWKQWKRLYGEGSPRFWHIIVTLGSQGYKYLTPNSARDDGEVIRGPSLANPDKIRHVCGAGDSFMAGFIAGWLRHADVPLSLDYASIAAASAIEQPYTAVADPNDGRFAPYLEATAA